MVGLAKPVLLSKALTNRPFALCVHSSGVGVQDEDREVVLARGSVPGLSKGSKDVVRTHTEAEIKTTDALLKVYQKRVEDGVVDIDLVIATIQHIVTHHAAIDGAILVFLPGWDDITKTRDVLLAHPVW